MDASFKELAALIREVWEDARLKGTRLDFALVYPMPTGQITMKPLGSVTIGRRANDDLVALGQTRFKIGDYIDVAVYPAGAAGPGARRPREY
jgi:histone deacetylase complex subunit SAP18